MNQFDPIKKPTLSEEEADSQALMFIEDLPVQEDTDPRIVSEPAKPQKNYKIAVQSTKDTTEKSAEVLLNALATDSYFSAHIYSPGENDI